MQVRRDWLGHSIQLILILATIGIPLVYWGSGINTTLATTTAQIAQHSQAMTDLQKTNTVLAGQINEVNRQLGRIDGLLSNIVSPSPSQQRRR